MGIDEIKMGQMVSGCFGQSQDVNNKSRVNQGQTATGAREEGIFDACLVAKWTHPRNDRQNDSCQSNSCQSGSWSRRYLSHAMGQ